MASGAKASAVQLLWLSVVYYAYVGNPRALVTVAKIAIGIQVVVGASVFFWMNSDPSAQLYFGTPDIFLISMGVPTVFWVILLFRSKVLLDRRDQTEADPKVEHIERANVAEKVDGGMQFTTSSHSQTIENLTLGTRNPQPSSVSSNGLLVSADVAEDGKRAMRHNGLGEKARIAIEYDPSAALAWGRVQALPERYREAFLAKLDANPSSDSTELAIVLEAEYLRELRPFDSDDANDAYEQAGTISVDAQSEFRKVYQLLRSTVSASEILSKIEHRFGPSEITKQRETARIEAERAAAEEDRIQRMEAYSAAMERQRAARAQEEQAEAARRASEQIEQARLNAEIQAAEKIEIIAKTLAMQEAKRRIAADRARQFRHGLALIGRYQLHALMVSLLALLYFAFAFA